MENNFFLARFTNEEDRTFTLTRGPWLIGGNYLVIQQWRFEFEVTEETISSMAVWIRVSGLYIELMNADFLEQVKNYIRKSLKVDVTTMQQTRGKYARICAEINVNKPLKTFLRFKEKYLHLEYEGLSTICYNCGRFSHTKEGCTHNQPPTELVNGQNEGAISNTSKDQHGANPIPPGFEPWIQVPQIRGRRNTVIFRNKAEVNKKYQVGVTINEKVPGNAAKSSSSLHMGSRFQALQEMSDEADLIDQVRTNGIVSRELGGTSFTISYANNTYRETP